MNWLENENIKLRAVEPSDIDFLYKLENDTAIWQVSNTLNPFSRYIILKYIENSGNDIFTNKELRLIIELKSNPPQSVGIIDMFDFDFYHKRAGLGISINSNFRNQNYAFQTLQIIINYAFNYLNLHQLYCNITEDNIPSLNLFQKAGFVITGEKKDWNFFNQNYKSEYLLQIINQQLNHLNDKQS